MSGGPCKVLLCSQKATIALGVFTTGKYEKKFLKDLVHPGWMTSIQDLAFSDAEDVAMYNDYITAVEGAPMTIGDVETVYAIHASLATEPV